MVVVKNNQIKHEFYTQYQVLSFDRLDKEGFFRMGNPAACTVSMADPNSILSTMEVHESSLDILFREIEQNYCNYSKLQSPHISRDTEDYSPQSTQLHQG